MSFLLQAPYPALLTTTLLPSPNWGDSVALKGTVTSMRSVDGTLYTYVKTKGSKKAFQWDFELSRNKALELRAFVEAYFGKVIRITDHDGDVWIGYLVNNPFEFSTNGAAQGWPGDEAMTVRLEFEEK
jgi:hypothetical protein